MTDAYYIISLISTYSIKAIDIKVNNNNKFFKPYVL